MSKSVNTGISSMVFGAEWNDFAVVSLASKPTYVMYLRRCLPVAEMSAKYAAEIRKTRKIFSFIFC
jgi:hypothetical protein